MGRPSMWVGAARELGRGVTVAKGGHLLVVSPSTAVSIVNVII